MSQAQIIVFEGGSGAGKSHLAQQLVASRRATPAPLIHEMADGRAGPRGHVDWSREAGARYWLPPYHRRWRLILRAVAETLTAAYVVERDWISSAVFAMARAPASGALIAADVHAVVAAWKDLEQAPPRRVAIINPALTVRISQLEKRGDTRAFGASDVDGCVLCLDTVRENETKLYARLEESLRARPGGQRLSVDGAEYVLSDPIHVLDADAVLAPLAEACTTAGVIPVHTRGETHDDAL